MEEQYRPFSEQTTLPNFFWGQYIESNWAGGFGIYMAGGVMGRAWHNRFVLASFDQKNIVTTFAVVSDKDVVPRLEALRRAGDLPPLDLSTPVPLKARPIPGDTFGSPMILELTAAGLNITSGFQQLLIRKGTRSQSGAASAFIPIDQVRDLKIEGYDENIGEASSKAKISLRFSSKSTFRQDLSLEAEPDVVLTLVRWFGQAKAAKP